MEWISKSSLASFLSLRPFSIVHIDADWDGYRAAMSDKLLELAPRFETSVSFGYADWDIEPEYVRDVGVWNVPSVAYYSGMKLIGVVIGIQQDIAENIERTMRGERLNQ